MNEEIAKMPEAAMTENFVGKHLTYPVSDRVRQAEGGKRLKGELAQSLADEPLVTIITVCWNSARTIEQTIRSVLNQTYRNIEYVIIDGNSTDGTVDILRQYEADINYFVSEPDDGLYFAMNKGLELASGDYIIFLNSDDWYEPECIELLQRGVNASGADFSCALATYVGQNETIIRVLPRMPYDDSCKFGMSLRHELMLIPKYIYNDIGNYDENFNVVADFDLSIRIYNKGYRLYEINRPLLNFRVNGVSNTNWPKLIAEHNQLYKKHFPELDNESLSKLSDPRKLNVELLDDVMVHHRNHLNIIRSLTAYGYRRNFYTDKRPPVIECHNSPRISIIVPVFNAFSFIERCLNSIITQEIKDIEIICIDDKSTDGSLNVLHELAKKNNKICVLANEFNKGVAFTRNRGIAKAKGDYVFFVDADDEITVDGLAYLLQIAETHNSDIVRGALEKVLAGNNRTVIEGYPPNNTNIINTKVFETVGLLNNAEGFSTCLYRRHIAGNCRFSDGMVVGEDSLFLIKCYLYSTKISWVDRVVYRYIQHDNSAMNTFDYKKYCDAIEWREKAWILLNDQGLKERAEWFAHKYWNPQILLNLDANLTKQQANDIKTRLSNMLIKTDFKVVNHHQDSKSIVAILSNIHNDKAISCPSLSKKLRIGVFNTFDRGGAATGSIRRVKALRNSGVEATLHPLVSTSNYDFVKPLTVKESQSRSWDNVNRNSILPPKNDPNFKAMELFSLPYSVIDYRKYEKLISSFDILHLHWVVGILDYENIGSVLGDKPVVWTLADMNAFTGGCHYSEGCEEFKKECRQCHLLSTNNSLAYEAWKLKKNAYDKIKNLTIICPSEWMAKQVKESSLLSDRDVRIIPNAFPIDEFKPYHRKVARIKLGLPIHKKLIMFGADSLANKRKGGDILFTALTILKEKLATTNDSIEIVTYGNHSIDLPFKVNSLGFINNTKKLSLASSACDVYAFPSREDNAPLTVSEALLCGTPVVAFSVGNVPDLVEHKVNGYIANYCDPVDLANGFMWILQDIDFLNQIKLSIKCRVKSSSFHDPNLCAQRHISLYFEKLK